MCKLLYRYSVLVKYMHMIHVFKSIILLCISSSALLMSRMTTIAKNVAVKYICCNFNLLFLFFQMFKTIYLKLDSILHRLQALLVCYQFQLDWSHASRVKTIQGGYCIYLFSSYHVYDVLQFPLFLADIIKVKNLFSFLH